FKAIGLFVDHLSFVRAQSANEPCGLRVGPALIELFHLLEDLCGLTLLGIAQLDLLGTFKLLSDFKLALELLIFRQEVGLAVDVDRALGNSARREPAIEPVIACWDG